MLISLKISVVLIGVGVLGLLIFWLPNIAKDFAISDHEYAYLRYPLLIGIYGTAIPFYIGVYHSFNLMNLIEKDGAFTEKACKSLGAISISSVLVMAIYIIEIVFLNINRGLHPGIFLFGVLVIFFTFIISIFASILKGLLMKVVEIKDENDFTI